MRRLTINLSDNRRYDIIIESGILSRLSSYIEEVYPKHNIFIITDSNVSLLYLEKVEKSLQLKFQVKHIIIEASESSKGLQTYANVCQKLLDLDIKRNNLLIALGGGVVGDLTGFIAATLYRGLEYINIPTTLLSQMDSSIGGKTGIDFYNRKNVLGAFKQPLRVLIDSEALKTLPEVQIASGMGELIKHAAIGNYELLEILKDHPKIDEHVISLSLMVKKRIVELDEFDQGERMKLNFGHTFGHLIELKYNLTHGEAVGIGMLMAIKLGIDLGVTKTDIYPVIENIMKSYNMATICYDYHSYLHEAIYDKKNLSGILNLVLLTDIGKCILYPIKEEDLKKLGD